MVEAVLAIAKVDCDELKAKFAEIIPKITASLTKAKGTLETIEDPIDMLSAVKTSYLEAIDIMLDTLEYSHSINVLSRMTKQLQQGRAEPQDALNIDVFERVEHASVEFIQRLKEYEMQFVHSEEKLAVVTQEQ